MHECFKSEWLFFWSTSRVVCYRMIDWKKALNYWMKGLEKPWIFYVFWCRNPACSVMTVFARTQEGHIWCNDRLLQLSCSIISICLCSSWVHWGQYLTSCSWSRAICPRPHAAAQLQPVHALRLRRPARLAPWIFMIDRQRLALSGGVETGGVHIN